MNIKFELETLFNRSVDIVMPKAIKNGLIKTYIFQISGNFMQHGPIVAVEDASRACKLILSLLKA